MMSMMKPYERYVDDVLSGRIRTGSLIKLAVERGEKLRQRDDIYLDEEEVDRCIEFFKCLKHPKGKLAGSPFILRDFQCWIISQIIGLKWKADGRRVCKETYIQVARKLGKALSLDTPIPTPNGYTTMGELEVGDVVFGSDGKPCNVTYVTDVMYDHECYKVKFYGGEEIIADSDHNWWVKDKNCDELKVLTTGQMKDNFMHKRNDGKGVEYRYRVPMCKPVEYEVNSTLPMDPYTLGAWLGDGSVNKPEFTTNITDLPIYDRIAEIYGPYKLRKDKRTNAYTVRFCGDYNLNNTRFADDLKKCGVYSDKHIPSKYLSSSIEDRKKLLMGLLDTDGYVSKDGVCEITQKNNRLAEGICKLLSSLGFTYKHTKKIPSINGIDKHEVNRIVFYCDKSDNLFSVDRKKDRLKDKLNKRMDFKSIISIEKVESVPVKCITVDSPDHTYLCGKQYTVTHNTAFVGGLVLYLMVCSGEAGFEGCCLANSRDQARILFDYIKSYGKCLDNKGKYLKMYRNYISLPTTESKVTVYSADASKLDGLDASCYVIDEYHEAKDRKLYDVMKSSTVARESPLGIIITTAGFHLDGPCFDMYNLAVEVLNGVKVDETFFPFIYSLDEDDDWRDPENFIKCQPNLDVTVSTQAMLDEVRKAMNDSTAETGVKTKTFNIWCQSNISWLPREQVAKCMTDVNLDDYVNRLCYIGVDLSSTDDLTAISVLVPLDDGTFALKTLAYLPEASLERSPNRELYKQFIKEGTLTLTPGNVVDYDYVTNDIMRIGQKLTICKILYDKWNSSNWSIQCTEKGLPMQQYSQTVGHFNAPTRQFEKLVYGGKIKIDKSRLFLWCVGNVTIKEDWSENRKPVKSSPTSKIDPVISSLMSLGGYIDNPISTSFEIIGIKL